MTILLIPCNDFDAVLLVEGSFVVPLLSSPSLPSLFVRILDDVFSPKEQPHSSLSSLQEPPQRMLASFETQTLPLCIDLMVESKMTNECSNDSRELPLPLQCLCLDTTLSMKKSAQHKPRIKKNLLASSSMLQCLTMLFLVNSMHAFQYSQNTWYAASLRHERSFLYAEGPINKNKSAQQPYTYTYATNKTKEINELQIVKDEIRKRMSSKGTDWHRTTRQLVNHMLNSADHNNKEASKLVNDAFIQITHSSFASSSWESVKFGLEIMELQVNYHSIPRAVCLQALKALNTLMRRRSGEEESCLQATAAFRILQRLCTGIGIQQNGNSQVQIVLDERDFSMVLNGFVNTGQMNMAHRVVALQLRTEHAPPLSPVTYSILIKGYGRLKDVESVNQVLEQAKMNGVDPDTIMYNSLIDAYINCDDVPKAFEIFQSLTKPRASATEQEIPLPTANLRTYNTMLKGFVKAQNMEKALALSKDMELVELWDAVTTNTLVGVAVATKNFDMAESILDKYTTKAWDSEDKRKRKSQHPNVEAYTELLSGYAKSSRLNKALATMQVMRQRGVDPNQYTYSSLIGALAKAQKIGQAKKLLSFMADSDGIPPNVVTYNALFTGMLEKSDTDNGEDEDELATAFNKSVNEALRLLGVMLKERVYPNAITIATLVDALGRCKPSRVDEAKALIDKMDADRFVARTNARVSTTLIRACAGSSDLEGALNAYRGIKEPDVIAFNALLNTFCQCGRVKMAIDVLSANLKKKKKEVDCIIPDVVTYTILISSLLEIGTAVASRGSFKLFREMKVEWSIVPDAGLVDA